MKYISHIYQNKVSVNFIIIGSVAFIQAINNILLGVILSKEGFGEYSFLFTSILPLVSSIVILGQGTSIVRYFSKYNLSDFQWKKYFRNISIVMLGMILAVVFFIWKFYALSVIYYIYLSLTIFSVVILKLIACILRSKAKFSSAVILERISPPIFVIFIGILYLFDIINLNTIATFKTISLLLPALIISYVFFMKEKDGSRNIDKKIYSDGLLLWGIGLVILTADRIDNFIIVKCIDYRAVAEYSIMILFMSIYLFAAASIWNVYSQRFASDYSPSIRRFLSKIVAIAISISLFYLIVGKPLLHFLFKGKYDNVLYLLLPFCIIGCLRLVYMYPSCYLVGKSQSGTLKQFLYLNMLGIILKIIFLVLGVVYMGLMGAVLSGILIWCYRNIVAYLLVFKDIKRTQV